MRYGRHFVAATLGVSLIFGGVAVGPVSLTPSAIAQSAGTAGTVAVDFLNVRLEPSTTGAIVATLPAGSGLTVLAGPVSAGGFNWYQVQAGERYGWAVSTFVVTGGTGTTPDPGTNPGTGPGAQWVYGDTVTVTTDALNVRALPSMSAQILEVYRSGRVATVTGDAQVVDGTTWYPLDRLGWVAGQFLSSGVNGGDGGGTTPGTIPAPTVNWVYGDAVTVTTDVLNVRELPSLSSPVVARYALTRAATVTGDATSGDGIMWYPLDNLGWVSGQFLASATGAPAPSTPGTTPGTTPAPANPGTPNPTTLAYGDAVTVSANLLNVRALPGVNQAVVATYPAGKQAVITGHTSTADGYTWVAVDRLGWVVADFLTYVGPGTVPAAAPANVSATGVDTTASAATTPAAARPSSTATSPSLRPTTAPRATRAPQEREETDEVESAGTEDEARPVTTARPSSSVAPAPVYVTPTVTAQPTEAPVVEDEQPVAAADGTFADGQTVVVDTGRLNIRSGPSYGASVVRIVDNGAEFTVYGEPVEAEGYTWYRISATQEEWVDGQFLVTAE